MSKEDSKESKTEMPPVDWLETMLHVTDDKSRMTCFHNAWKCMEKLLKIHPNMQPFVKTELLRSLMYADVDFAHLIFFLVIPNIECITKAVRANISERRFRRFVDHLTFHRSNLIDGLTDEQQDCAKASEVQFKSIRHFIWKMRSFYLMKSCSNKTDRAVRPQYQAALWNRTEAYRHHDASPFFFAIVAMYASEVLDCDYTNFLANKLPEYQSADGRVITRCPIVSPPPLLSITPKNFTLARGKDYANLQHNDCRIVLQHGKSDKSGAYTETIFLTDLTRQNQIQQRQESEQQRRRLKDSNSLASSSLGFSSSFSSSSSSSSSSASTLCLKATTTSSQPLKTRTPLISTPKTTIQARGATINPANRQKSSSSTTLAVMDETETDEVSMPIQQQQIQTDDDTVME